MSKQFWAVIAVLAVVFVGAIFINNRSDSTTKGAAGTATNHVEGSTSSGVKLLEYGDYQCPACGAFYQTVKDTVAKYQDKIQFQFRNLPLTSLHPNAFAGARAAEAAGLQGKYFEMHDMLYENQSGWTESSTPLNIFSSYAKGLGLNVTQFKADFASSKVNNSINADLAAFDKTGAEKATPTFFLNGKQVSTDKLVDSSGQPSVDAFSKVIDAAIAAKTNSTTKQ
jgi:protein-disulfide isomerase